MSTALRAGSELGPSEWLESERTTIDAVAACTCDGQRAHASPDRAAL